MPLLRWLYDYGKGLLALTVAFFSVILGLYSVVLSFGFAVAIQVNLWFLPACLLLAALAFCFLIVIPKYIYWWRFGFPVVPHRSKSPFLARYRKSQPF